MAPGFKLSFTAVLVLIWLAVRYSGNANSGRIVRVGRAAKQMWTMQMMLLFGLALILVMLLRPTGLWPSPIRKREFARNQE